MPTDRTYFLAMLVETKNIFLRLNFYCQTLIWLNQQNHLLMLGQMNFCKALNARAERAHLWD